MENEGDKNNIYDKISWVLMSSPILKNIDKNNLILELIFMKL